MRLVEEYRTTNNSSVYKKIWKYVERRQLRCVICPPHKGENADGIRHPYRNWKWNRKTKYKGV